MMLEVFQFQFSKIKANPLTFLLVSITALTILYIGYIHTAFAQSIAYLGVMWMCSFCIDFYALRKKETETFEVRKPKLESFFFFSSFLLGMLFLYVRFSPSIDWQNLKGILKLALLPLVLFLFPIALGIFLLVLKYKPRELGFRLQGFILIVPIIVISAITNRLVSPQSLTWDNILLESGGIVGALYTGLILAGLSEEFFRVVGQTRLAALLNNTGLAWFSTTFLWAFMHAPKWYAQDPNLQEVILGSIRIIPIGLMWGYLTYRTKSVLPSIFVHGTNYWGLQNF
ncbi:MAG: hypothetical protein CFE21_08835 [Bacteroidetes bacterium B1(2017)]|nr:MAG: hypothetical protein CFE21_08835 [Bacteroidetes bacterium B1(2017)]